MVIKSQIKSKKRVLDHGEVFTNPREVENMVNLVSGEIKRLDSRFLEPACGDGNFLEEILKRKLQIVKSIKNSVIEWKKNTLTVFSSLYGVELLEDNVIHCRERLFNVFYKKFYPKKFKDIDLEKSIKIILNLNIIHGDALELKDNKGYALTFAEWSLIGDKVQRRDFKLMGLLTETKYNLMHAEKNNSSENQSTLFDDLPEEDFEEAGLIKENVYPLIHFLKIGEFYE